MAVDVVTKEDLLTMSREEVASRINAFLDEMTREEISELITDMVWDQLETVKNEELHRSRRSKKFA